jgi:translation initiation factor IF-3
MITALQLRVLGVDGQQLGVMERADALNLARSLNIDLVEIAPNANPPVCRLIDYPELARKMSEGEEKSKQDDPGIG